MDEFKELLWMNNGFYLTLPILFALIQHRSDEAVRGEKLPLLKKTIIRNYLLSKRQIGKLFL
ncbi:hypothetical protein T02_10203 [Trichinella nativa]|uniref:Uncharacterized protein n=1 Tax=Trichinella nativa TaxID=6335 RepID=A0A0V1L776_9BILA|nr:hypothetical protein T06_12923 [Trichinella sp. T6]KRZ55403.1 hypothetical protein T02_10203 [Trichinella nativa]